ncbi:MFS transporter [Xenorhabdus bovienii]|uniref:MFS transporter n=1 Tax=Xenorhabdus bovienii TaxID=40576 RepID=UPI001EE14114|nr:MFS transporter [Xenorhabdus bovienii]MCG3462478.1 MFS transporter [Xenorhabdus bovienii]
MLQSVVQRGVRYIVSHYLMTYLGYYGLLSTLVVTLNAANFDAAQIAILVMVFTLTNKIAKMPLAYWLDKIPAATSVLLGCLMAAAGFLMLAFAQGMLSTGGALVIAGTGISINALASKQVAAAVSDGLANRAHLFSKINIGINVAAAVAAPLALWLVTKQQGSYVLFAVAAMYCLAGITTFSNFSRIDTEKCSTASSSFGVYANMLTIPGLRSFLMINFFGWLLYGQLFNVLALYVSKTLEMSGKLGWLYTLNALLVVFLQLAVMRLTAHWQIEKPILTVIAAYAIFSLAFISVYLVPGYFGAVMFVVIFTFAEMMFMPSMDVLLLSIIGQGSRAVGYSILSISTALGETIGGGMGVAIYRGLADQGYSNSFWLLLALISLLFTLITHVLARKSHGLKRIGKDDLTSG